LDAIVDLLDRLCNGAQALVGQDQDGALGHERSVLHRGLPLNMVFPGRRSTASRFTPGLRQLRRRRTMRERQARIV
ncbi:MAG TPA: hypothetical protein VGV07_20375, partial [Devosia sp.]|uniref:hypothetical protein n=1 Tax=Devosia sp. TaxID=1871048 RepID=UPI002DDD2A74